MLKIFSTRQLEYMKILGGVIWVFGWLIMPVFGEKYIGIALFTIIVPPFLIISLAEGEIQARKSDKHKGFKNHQDKRNKYIDRQDKKSEKELKVFDKNISQWEEYMKPIIISTISGVLTFVITHTLFGFGTTEASISSLLIAVILGAIGYST